MILIFAELTLIEVEGGWQVFAEASGDESCLALLCFQERTIRSVPEPERDGLIICRGILGEFAEAGSCTSRL